MKFVKKIGRLFLLILIIGLILFLVKSLVDRTKESILIENKIGLTITPIPIISSELFLVTKIIDGDTLLVNINDKEESVRLIGVDTPEIKDSLKPVQCFGKEASDRAKELMENKKVRLEVDTSQTDRDTYNRLLRYVYLENGTLVNKKLIEEGFGREYTYKIPYKFQVEFKETQKTAKNKKVGLWAENACLN